MCVCNSYWLGVDAVLFSTNIWLCSTILMLSFRSYNSVHLTGIFCLIFSNSVLNHLQQGVRFNFVFFNTIYKVRNEESLIYVYKCWLVTKAILYWLFICETLQNVGLLLACIVFLMFGFVWGVFWCFFFLVVVVGFFVRVKTFMVRLNKAFFCQINGILK